MCKPSTIFFVTACVLSAGCGPSEAERLESARQTLTDMLDSMKAHPLDLAGQRYLIDKYTNALNAYQTASDVVQPALVSGLLLQNTIPPRVQVSWIEFYDSVRGFVLEGPCGQFKYTFDRFPVNTDMYKAAVRLTAFRDWTMRVEDVTGRGDRWPQGVWQQHVTECGDEAWRLPICVYRGNWTLIAVDDQHRELSRIDVCVEEASDVTGKPADSEEEDAADASKVPE